MDPKMYRWTPTDSSHQSPRSIAVASELRRLGCDVCCHLIQEKNRPVVVPEETPNMESEDRRAAGVGVGVSAEVNDIREGEATVGGEGDEEKGDAGAEDGGGGGGGGGAGKAGDAQDEGSYAAALSHRGPLFPRREHTLYKEAIIRQWKKIETLRRANALRERLGEERSEQKGAGAGAEDAPGTEADSAVQSEDKTLEDATSQEEERPFYRSVRSVATSVRENHPSGAALNPNSLCVWKHFPEVDSSTSTGDLSDPRGLDVVLSLLSDSVEPYEEDAATMCDLEADGGFLSKTQSKLFASVDDALPDEAENEEFAVSEETTYFLDESDIVCNEGGEWYLASSLSDEDAESVAKIDAAVGCDEVDISVVDQAINTSRTALTEENRSVSATLANQGKRTKYSSSTKKEVKVDKTEFYNESYNDTFDAYSEPVLERALQDHTPELSENAPYKRPVTSNEASQSAWEPPDKHQEFSDNLAAGIRRLQRSLADCIKSTTFRRRQRVPSARYKPGLKSQQALGTQLQEQLLASQQNLQRRSEQLPESRSTLTDYEIHNLEYLNTAYSNAYPQINFNNHSSQPLVYEHPEAILLPVQVPVSAPDQRMFRGAVNTNPNALPAPWQSYVKCIGLSEINRKFFPINTAIHFDSGAKPQGQPSTAAEMSNNFWSVKGNTDASSAQKSTTLNKSSNVDQKKDSEKSPINSETTASRQKSSAKDKKIVHYEGNENVKIHTQYVEWPKSLNSPLNYPIAPPPSPTNMGLESGKSNESRASNRKWNSNSGDGNDDDAKDGASRISTKNEGNIQALSDDDPQKEKGTDTKEPGMSGGSKTHPSSAQKQSENFKNRSDQNAKARPHSMPQMLECRREKVSSNYCYAAAFDEVPTNTKRSVSNFKCVRIASKPVVQQQTSKSKMKSSLHRHSNQKNEQGKPPRQIEKQSRNEKQNKGRDDGLYPRDGVTMFDSTDDESLPDCSKKANASGTKTGAEGWIKRAARELRKAKSFRTVAHRREVRSRSAHKLHVSAAAASRRRKGFKSENQWSHTTSDEEDVQWTEKREAPRSDKRNNAGSKQAFRAAASQTAEGHKPPSRHAGQSSNQLKTSEQFSQIDGSEGEQSFQKTKPSDKIRRGGFGSVNNRKKMGTNHRGGFGKSFRDNDTQVTEETWKMKKRLNGFRAGKRNGLKSETHCGDSKNAYSKEDKKQCPSKSRMQMYSIMQDDNGDIILFPGSEGKYFKEGKTQKFLNNPVVGYTSVNSPVFEECTPSKPLKRGPIETDLILDCEEDFSNEPPCRSSKSEEKHSRNPKYLYKQTIKSNFEFGGKHIQRYNAFKSRRLLKSPALNVKRYQRQRSMANKRRRFFQNQQSWKESPQQKSKKDICKHSTISERKMEQKVCTKNSEKSLKGILKTRGKEQISDSDSKTSTFMKPKPDGNRHVNGRKQVVESHSEQKPDRTLAANLQHVLTEVETQKQEVQRDIADYLSDLAEEENENRLADADSSQYTDISSQHGDVNSEQTLVCSLDIPDDDLGGSSATKLDTKPSTEIWCVQHPTAIATIIMQHYPDGTGLKNASADMEEPSKQGETDTKRTDIIPGFQVATNTLQNVGVIKGVEKNVVESSVQTTDVGNETKSRSAQITSKAQPESKDKTVHSNRNSSLENSTSNSIKKSSSKKCKTGTSIHSTMNKKAKSPEIKVRKNIKALSVRNVKVRKPPVEENDDDDDDDEEEIKPIKKNSSPKKPCKKNIKEEKPTPQTVKRRKQQTANKKQPVEETSESEPKSSKRATKEKCTAEKTDDEMPEEKHSKKKKGANVNKGKLIENKSNEKNVRKMKQNKEEGNKKKKSNDKKPTEKSQLKDSSSAKGKNKTNESSENSKKKSPRNPTKDKRKAEVKPQDDPRISKLISLLSTEITKRILDSKRDGKERVLISMDLDSSELITSENTKNVKQTPVVGGKLGKTRKVAPKKEKDVETEVGVEVLKPKLISRKPSKSKDMTQRLCLKNVVSKEQEDVVKNQMVLADTLVQPSETQKQKEEMKLGYCLWPKRKDASTKIPVTSTHIMNQTALDSTSPPSTNEPKSVDASGDTSEMNENKTHKQESGHGSSIQIARQNADVRNAHEENAIVLRSQPRSERNSQPSNEAMGGNNNGKMPLISGICKSITHTLEVTCTQCPSKHSSRKLNSPGMECGNGVCRRKPRKNHDSKCLDAVQYSIVSHKSTIFCPTTEFNRKPTKRTGYCPTCANGVCRRLPPKKAIKHAASREPQSKPSPRSPLKPRAKLNRTKLEKANVSEAKKLVSKRPSTKKVQNNSELMQQGDNIQSNPPSDNNNYKTIQTKALEMSTVEPRTDVKEQTREEPVFSERQDFLHESESSDNQEAFKESDYSRREDDVFESANDQDLVGFSDDQDLVGFSDDQDLAGFSDDQDLAGFSDDQDLAGFSNDHVNYVGDDQNLAGLSDQVNYDSGDQDLEFDTTKCTEIILCASPKEIQSNQLMSLHEENDGKCEIILECRQQTQNRRICDSYMECQPRLWDSNKSHVVSSQSSPRIVTDFKEAEFSTKRTLAECLVAEQDCESSEYSIATGEEGSKATLTESTTAESSRIIGMESKCSQREQLHLKTSSIQSIIASRSERLSNDANYSKKSTKKRGKLKRCDSNTNIRDRQLRKQSGTSSTVVNSDSATTQDTYQYTDDPLTDASHKNTSAVSLRKYYSAVNVSGRAAPTSQRINRSSEECSRAELSGRTPAVAMRKAASCSTRMSSRRKPLVRKTRTETTVAANVR